MPAKTTTKPASKPATKPAAKAAVAEVVVRFAIERETKNTIRFWEVDANNQPIENDAVVRTLYVQRDSLAKLGNPEVLTVTIQPA